MIGASGGLANTGFFGNPYGEMSEIDSEMTSESRQLKSGLPKNSTYDLNGKIVNSTGTALENFYNDVWVPFGQDFSDYIGRHSNIGLKIAINTNGLLSREMWRELQDYREKLGNMREAAKKAGFVFSGPDPTPRKKDDFTKLIETGADAVGSIFGSMWNAIKPILYILAIGLGLGFIVYQYQRYRK